MCFGIHSQPGPCSFCSNLQGRGWWLRSHLIINAGAVKLCHRSRPLGYCWSEALSKQNDSDWDSSLLREAMLVLIGLTFSDSSFVRLASIPVQDKGKLVRLVTYFSILSHELCCKALIKCWLPGWTSSHSKCHISPQGRNTQSLRQVSHLNYLPGSSGCRCLYPPSPHSSIKGIFTFTGAWFLWERPRLRLTITSLSMIQWFNTLIPFHYNPALQYRSLLFQSLPLIWYLETIFTVLVHINKLIHTSENPVSISFGPSLFLLSEEGDQVAENGPRLWGGVRGRGVCRTAISYFQCPS